MLSQTLAILPLLLASRRPSKTLGEPSGAFFGLPEENFAIETTAVWATALNETRALNQREIDTGELLLALISRQGRAARRVLADAGADWKAARVRLKEQIGYGDKPFRITRLRGRLSLAERPLSRQAQAAAKKAVRWAKKLRQTEIRNEHLLLGLLDTKGCVAIRILESLRIDSAALRQRALDASSTR